MQRCRLETTTRYFYPFTTALLLVLSAFWFIPECAPPPLQTYPAPRRGTRGRERSRVCQAPPVIPLHSPDVQHASPSRESPQASLPSRAGLLYAAWALAPREHRVGAKPACNVHLACNVHPACNAHLACDITCNVHLACNVHGCRCGAPCDRAVTFLAPLCGSPREC